MASHVSIIEDSTQGRILLRSMLSAAHYQVSTLSGDEWLSARPAETPDLIILGPTLEEPTHLLEKVSGSGYGSGVPILVLVRDAAPKTRLELIECGAREVLGYPLAGALLSARIRTLLREADAYKEIDRRRSALSSVGFSEAAPTFAAVKRITVVRDNSLNPPLILPASAGGWYPATTSVSEALAPPERVAVSSGYILDWRGSQPNSPIRRALPELRDRLHSRHASILVLVDDADDEGAIHALDTGASDVISGDALTEEIECRIERVLKQKAAEDALRQNSEASISLAMTDDLTGLYNRRYAERYLARLLQERSPEQPFALMMADIDRFKMINDGLGHAAGDAVLKEIAARLRSEVRSIDLVARYGGEEFLVVLADSNRDQASRAADRLRRSIGRTPVNLPGKGKIDVTVSIGVSFGDGLTSIDSPSVPRFDTSALGAEAMSHLLAQADRALYRAKEKGRDQVSLAATSA